MSPDQFLRQLQKQGPAPVYLFIGPDAYMRDQCRRALVESALGSGDRDQGLVHHDIDQENLAAIIDDACTLSLFADRRLLWVASAEAALPRGKIAESEEEGPGSKQGAALIASYVRDPSPGTVVVFNCSRYEFDGEDRARIDRVQKFYSAVPNVVEFARFDEEAAMGLAQRLAQKLGLQIGNPELSLLVEALGSDASRIDSELEKLSLFAGTNRRIEADDIARLVPNARENTIFELVAALGSGNRSRSLEVLDVLVREGEYLPLALSFLATQLRLALIARDSGARTAGEIRSQFNRLGIRTWGDRANQVRQTLQAFPNEKLESAVKKVAAADRNLRDFRPDDRVVMEELILSLTT